MKGLQIGVTFFDEKQGGKLFFDILLMPLVIFLSAIIDDSALECIEKRIVGEIKEVDHEAGANDCSKGMELGCIIVVDDENF